MTFIHRFESAKTLWAIMLPGVELPPDKTLCSWLNVYGDGEFETAIVHIPRRIESWRRRYKKFDPVNVYKLMSTYLKIAKETKNRKKKDVDVTRICRPEVEVADAPQSQRKEAECYATV
ncbi:MAG TPA: hypothetical protein VKQ11_22940 [Candidatus Sulfotelmatobacter sp.]|nr:hypothetical protein [Candidatus Sulfotelmatobacter sp.]